MKKYLIVILLFISLVGIAQTTPSGITRVANSTTVFGKTLSAGQLLSDINSGKTYRILRAVVSTAKLTDLSLGVDYIELSTAEYYQKDSAAYSNTLYSQEVDIKTTGINTYPILRFKKTGYGFPNNNIFSLIGDYPGNGTGNLVFYNNGIYPGAQLTLHGTGASEFRGELKVGDIYHATTDLDHFLVDSSGWIKYRTGAQLLSDIGAGYVANPSSKKWVLFGDSFSDDVNGEYCAVVTAKLGLTGTVTQAVAGHTMDLQLGVLNTILAGTPTYFNAFDIVTLLVGVNDYASNYDLGNRTDLSSASTYAGYLKKFIETLLTAKPSIELYVMTPPEGNSALVPYKALNAATTPWTLKQMSVLISQICSDYGVRCIDLYSLLQFNLQTFATLTSDNLHPNGAGAILLGNLVADAFVSNHDQGKNYDPSVLSANYIPKAYGGTIKNSQITDNGTSVTIPTYLNLGDGSTASYLQLYRSTSTIPQPSTNYAIWGYDFGSGGTVVRTNYGGLIGKVTFKPSNVMINTANGTNPRLTFTRTGTHTGSSTIWQYDNALFFALDTTSASYVMVNGTAGNLTATGALQGGSVIGNTFNNMSIATPAPSSSSIEIKSGKSLEVDNSLILTANTPGSTLNIGAGGTLRSGAFADVPTSNVYTVKISINNTDLKNAYETPITLIAAPGSGYAILVDPMMSAIRVNYVAPALTNSAISIYADGVSDYTLQAQAGTASNNLSVTSTKMFQFFFGNATDDENIKENAAIKLKPWGDITAGGGSIDLYLTYRIITL